MKAGITKQWYAIRVTYRQEMKVKHDLDRRHVESFIPMRTEIQIRGTRKIKVRIPAIHNLIFVRMDEDEMREYKMTTPLPIRYIMNKSTGKPTIIPDQQMNNFIGVAGSDDEQLIYLSPNPKEWKSGQRVRIIGGVMKGYEGRFVRVKGDRRVVVEIPGLIAVATGFIHPSMLEPIETTDA